jgi:hypothetical protein
VNDQQTTQTTPPAPAPVPDPVPGAVPAAAPAAAPAPATPPADGTPPPAPTTALTDSTPAPGSTAAAPDAAKAAPIVYDLKIPEGATGLVDEKDLDFFKSAGEQAKWTPEEAQAAVNEFTTLAQAQSARFLAETQADPTYGGAAFAQTQRQAMAVINRIRPAGHPRHDSFQAFLAKGGSGNHLEVISFLADLGKLMGEDTPVSGQSTSGKGGSGDDAARAFYTHPTSIALEKQAGGG